MLKRLASGSVDAEMVSKYTALAASYCLLRYIENNTGHAFANGRSVACVEAMNPKARSEGSGVTSAPVAG